MAEYTQASRDMKVDTVLGTDVLLLAGFRGVESVSEPFAYELELRSVKGDLKAADILRTAAVVTIDMPGGEKKIHGLVNRFVRLGQQGDLVSYRAEVVPWLWFLNLSHECRIHQQKSVLDIIETVFGDLGYSDFDIRCSGSYPKRDYCVQYRESHFNFVSRLMEEEGIYYYFEHTDDKHTMVLADMNGATETVPGEAVARVHAHTITDEDVVLWAEREESVHSGKVTLRSYDFLQPALSLESAMDGEFEEIYDYPGSYVSLDEGERYARIRLESSEARRKIIRGSGNCRNFTSGYFVELDFEDDSPKVKCLLLQVSHTMSGTEPWDNNATADYRNDFLAIPFDVPFRPLRRARKGLVRGTQTAVVVGPGGEEIWADKYGRIKVQFHWDRQGKKDEKSSCWVRVATPWAGKTWGAIHLPRIGQEVVVDFLEGDPDRPLVIGSVYNATQMPPYELPANVTQSGTKSRSSKEGTTDNFNEFRFEDKKGSELVYLHAEKNKEEVVENDNDEDIGHNESIVIGNDQKTNVGRDRTEGVGRDEVISIERNRTENVGKDESITISGNRTESVEKNEKIDITENRTESVGKDEKITVKGERVIKVTKDNELNVGKKLAIIAGDQIQLITGDASILMKKDGTITIKGKDIKITGGGKINIKADSDVTIKGSNVKQN